ncbi:MAG: hypothetical protein CVV44_22305 [Spirochaetae bacterium HGW-Spirochaetae-1]|jgi:HD-GYP domain-containing protein (c-di-GMP phosphodiesterase class II)|nr:MAG: hypothetical protein CVV44_22305 [Spirochaetae bacterium HGW-Spirochaetae-1]
MTKKVRLNVDYIRPNSTLVYPLYSDDGEKILAERTILSFSKLNEIKQKYGTFVYYNDTADRSIVPSYRVNIALNKAKAILNEVQSTNKLSKTTFRETEKVVEEIVTDLHASQIEAISLLKDLKSFDDYLYHHAVNVGILSGALARLNGYSLDDVKNITLGAYLLDIGHMMLDKQLSTKEGRYTISDKQKMKRHPQLGYELLKSIPGISPIVLQSVLFHHERFNNQGYFQMPYENLPEPPKIVGTCDMYDALTSKRPYRNAFTPSGALRIILNSINIHFDYNLVSSFINQLGSFLNSTQSFYAANDVCELNTNELALIKAIGSKDLLKPRVLIFCRFEKQQGSLAVRFYDTPLDVDLQGDEKRSITKILDNKQQVDAIRRKLLDKGLI